MNPPTHSENPMSAEEPTSEPNPTHLETAEATEAAVASSEQIETEELESSVDSDAEVETVPAAVMDDEPEAPAEPVVSPSNKKFYVVKVTSGREESIKAAIERRVKIEGLEEFFAQIVIPVERITEVKKVKETRNGEKVTKEKRVIKERKKFPGYIVAEVEFNDRILYLFRETSGVGDFVGATGPLKPPPPMTELEVRRMLGEPLGPGKPDDKKGPTIIKLDYEKGDKVRIREGMFANSEGEVKIITTPKEPGESPKVTVEVVIFGRPVPVELDYWQVDKV